MIIHKCDICKKNKPNLETIILYKKSFDYCEECKNKAEAIKKEYEKELKYQNILYNAVLARKEIDILRKYKK